MPGCASAASKVLCTLVIGEQDARLFRRGPHLIRSLRCQYDFTNAVYAVVSLYVTGVTVASQGRRSPRAKQWEEPPHMTAHANSTAEADLPPLTSGPHRKRIGLI